MLTVSVCAIRVAPLLSSDIFTIVIVGIHQQQLWLVVWYTGVDLFYGRIVVLYDTAEIIQFICNELQQVSIPWLFCGAQFAVCMFVFRFFFPLTYFSPAELLLYEFHTAHQVYAFVHVFLCFLIRLFFSIFLLIRVLWTNNNNNQDNVYGAVIMAEPLREFTALFDECRTALSGRRPKTKPDDLACESACTGCQNLHPPSPFIITQPKT